MENQKVSIPNPCHMKWADMEKTDNPQKRHCSSCAIDLIDFSEMSNEEIIAYLANHKNEKVCAHMKTPDFDELKGYQKKIVNAKLKVERNVGNKFFASILLGTLSLVLVLSGCNPDNGLIDGEVVGLPENECEEVYVPDTTTPEEGDSTWQEVCEQ